MTYGGNSTSCKVTVDGVGSNSVSMATALSVASKQYALDSAHVILVENYTHTCFTVASRQAWAIVGIVCLCLFGAWCVVMTTPALMSLASSIKSSWVMTSSRRGSGVVEDV
jgi:hypothetical protein